MDMHPRSGLDLLGERAGRQLVDAAERRAWTVAVLNRARRPFGLSIRPAKLRSPPYRTPLKTPFRVNSGAMISMA